MDKKKEERKDNGLWIIQQLVIAITLWNELHVDLQLSEGWRAT